jgi:hypothetical protein
MTVPTRQTLPDFIDCTYSHQLKNILCTSFVTTLISIYLSTAIGLTPGGITHLHINNTYNITINNKTTRITNKTTQITNLEACWPCPVFANYTLAFALQLRKKHGKNFSQGSQRYLIHFTKLILKSVFPCVLHESNNW